MNQGQVNLTNVKMTFKLADARLHAYVSATQALARPTARR